MQRFAGRPDPAPPPRSASPLLLATLGLERLHLPSTAFARRYRTGPLINTSNSTVSFGVDEWRGGKEVALKILDGDTGADEARRWMLLRDLDPRGVAAIVHVRRCMAMPVELDASPRTVLVFDRLTPLPALLARLRTLRDVAVVAQQVGTALAFLHTRGIVHADVKLENVLAEHVNDTNGACEWRVRVGDFGSALWPNELAHTPPDEVGTITHRAPELLLRHANSVAPASDVWAWGCLVIELYSRAALFPHPHEASLTRAHAEEHVLTQLRGLCGVFPSSLALATSKAPAHKNVAKYAWLFVAGGSGEARLHKVVKHVELASLLEALLQPDPTLRLTAVDALQMPLFAECSPLRLLLSPSSYPHMHPSSLLPLPPPGALLFAAIPQTSLPVQHTRAPTHDGARASAIVATQAPLPTTATPHTPLMHSPSPPSSSLHVHTHTRTHTHTHAAPARVEAKLQVQVQQESLLARATAVRSRAPPSSPFPSVVSPPIARALIVAQQRTSPENGDTSSGTSTGTGAASASSVVIKQEYGAGKATPVPVVRGKMQSRTNAPTVAKRKGDDAGGAGRASQGSPAKQARSASEPDERDEVILL